jgi:hypothetical protein
MKEDKRKNNGGLRSNSGRKPSADPKQRLTIWIEKSIIDKFGGLDNCKEICIETLKN